MRFVIIGVAVLVGLGLAAFGGLGSVRHQRCRNWTARCAVRACMLPHRSPASHQTKRQFRRSRRSVSLRNRRSRSCRRRRQPERCRQSSGTFRQRLAADRAGASSPNSARAERRQPNAARDRCSCPAAERHTGLRQAGRDGPFARRRNRHHRRPRVRLRTLQAIRFPPRQGGRADLRRRSLAREHHGGRQGAHQRMFESHVL